MITASAADKTSFGCSDERDLTYFGEAFYRDALPGAKSLRDAFETAKADIGAREKREDIEEASGPQAFFGEASSGTLRRCGLQHPDTLPVAECQASRPRAADTWGGSCRAVAVARIVSAEPLPLRATKIAAGRRRPVLGGCGGRVTRGGRDVGAGAGRSAAPAARGALDSPVARGTLT